MKSALFLVIAAGATAAAQSTPTTPTAPRETVVVKAANTKWVDHPFVKGAMMSVQDGDPGTGPSVVLMKFPKGMTVPPHWHTSDEVVTVVSGSATFGTGETVDVTKGTKLGAGSYILIPGKNPHWVVVKDELLITLTLDKAADFHAIEPQG